MTEKCEECGVKLGSNACHGEIGGRKVAFFCSHCADSYEKKTTTGRLGH